MDKKCERCKGSGYDPERVETLILTREGDIDIEYDPQPCRDCMVLGDKVND